MPSKSRLEAVRDHLAPTSSSPTIVTQEKSEVTQGNLDDSLPQTRTIFPPLELEDHAIDDVRPLRVAVVGAGISGITSALFLPAKVPKIDLVVYERESDIVSQIAEEESKVGKSHLYLGRSVEYKYIPWRTLRCPSPCVSIDF